MFVERPLIIRLLGHLPIASTRLPLTVHIIAEFSYVRVHRVSAGIIGRPLLLATG